MKTDSTMATRCTRRVPRPLLIIGAAALLILAGSAGIHAEVPHQFENGEKLTAEALNDAFEAMDCAQRLARGSFASQVLAVSTDAEGAWVDVPGLSATTEVLDDDTALDVIAHVDVTAENSSNPSQSAATSCSLRILVDGNPVGDPAHVQVNSPFSAVPSLATLLGDVRTTVAAGEHEVKVQIAKSTGVYANTRCVAGGATFLARGALRIRAGKD